MLGTFRQKYSMRKSSTEESNLQNQERNNAVKLFLRKMRERQSCCPVCPYCRDAINDEGIKLANTYAELAQE